MSSNTIQNALFYIEYNTHVEMAKSHTYSTRHNIYSRAVFFFFRLFILNTHNVIPKSQNLADRDDREKKGGKGKHHPINCAPLNLFKLQKNSEAGRSSYSWVGNGVEWMNWRKKGDLKVVYRLCIIRNKFFLQHLILISHHHISPSSFQI